ncbi:2,5-dichloro-2,5-cyclohexadiene-1,4-diol dehydrogenase [Lachnellula suecica]|uniref:2,5-dichloro-2,5-cyclohexadiene-1,4-diol dehydrogenase n=1 Tax=Lachnellula suecica TaxID=602035 RepID=A0A8T9C7J8_9HELO|nr:2,5-dichloro-2,5-cyclohexadiene-1,4-diol dehydrogenase [Lachnellula suecica]
MAFTSVDGVALITGATGIGQETGFAFAEAGALAVVFADLNEQGVLESAEASKKYASNPKFRAIGIKVDVTSQTSVKAMVDKTIKEFGRIDYSVNSAGVNSSAEHTTDIELEKYAAVIDVNLTGVMLCVSIVSKAMSTQTPVIYQGRHKERSLGRGCIVNVGSAASFAPGPNMMAYVASKHGVMGITKTAALDNEKYGIRVNAICPSYVDTPMIERAVKRVPGLEKMIAKASPLGRSAVPEEVANVIVFCCSPSASYINGIGLPVDAGMLLTARL